MRVTRLSAAISKLQDRLVASLFAGILLFVLPVSGLKASPVAYTDEAAFRSALSGLGLSPAFEGFENDTAWGGVRSSVADGFHTSASISNQGLTWTSNFTAGDVTTSNGAARSGDWGLFSYPHGSYNASTADCTQPGVCSDGIQGSAVSGVIHAIGGWFRTNTPFTELGMFVGSYPDNPVDFGETCDAGGENCVPNSSLGTAYKFFGLIDMAGFASFEYRELEGTNGDMKYIFGDDFLFAGSDIVSSAVPLPPSFHLLLGALGLAGFVRWRKGSRLSS